MAKKVWLSMFLVLVILSASIYIMIPDKVKISIENTRTKYFVWEDESWILSATEYVQLFQGTTKMRAKNRNLTTFTKGNETKIVRTSIWKDNITTIQTYLFNSSLENIESFPVENRFECFNCEGKIVNYEIRDILYEGETQGIESPFSFGHNMKIEWEEGNYYSKVFQQKVASDKIIIKYRPNSNYESYEVRLFDPVSDKYNVTFEFSKQGIISKCLDIQIQNLQDSSDNLDLKTVLNETNFDINNVNNLVFYEWKPSEILRFNYSEFCNPYNETTANGTIENTNCTQIVTGNFTEEIWNWENRQLLSSEKDGESELRNTWEQVPIQKFGNTKDTVKFKMCFDVPLEQTNSGWGNSGTIYLDLNGELFVDKTHSSWWNVSWDKKKEIKIQGSYNDTNYTVNLNVTYDPDMQSDFGDLRFTDSSETFELNYWIESKINGTSAQVWVKAPIISKDLNESIFMYFNSTDIVTTGNPNNTFVFYQDSGFDDWTITDGTFSAGTSLAGTSTFARAHKNFSSPEILNGWLLESSVSLDAGNNIVYFLIGNSTKTTCSGAVDCHRWRGTEYMWNGEGAGAPDFLVGQLNQTNGNVVRIIGDSRVMAYNDADIGDGWQNYNLTKNQTNEYTFQQNLTPRTLIDGAAGNPSDYLSGSVFDKLEFFGRFSGEKIDNITLRKYQEPEPVVFFQEAREFIKIDVPSNGGNFSANQTEINYTIADNSILDTCWYTIDLGTTNNTITCETNISNLNSSEGVNTWIVYLNQTNGNEESSSTTFLIDTIFPNIDFRLSASSNNSWITNSTIIADVIVNDSNPKNITYVLFNISGVINVTSLSMSDTFANTTFSFLNLADGNYSFNVSVFDLLDHFNSTEIREVYLDSVTPLINYTTISDITNSTANFSIKDNIFVNVTVVENNEKNITFLLYNLFGTVNLSVFTDNRREINWTGLSESMYFWNVTICDQASQCNTTASRNYGVESLNLTIEGFETNISVELGTNISINATNTLDIICVDIDHPNYGVNYSCSNQINFFGFIINFFRKIFFSDGTISKTLNMTKPGFNDSNFSIPVHQYDEVDNVSINLSGANNPTDVSIFKCNTTIFDRAFAGILVGSNVFLQNFSNLVDNSLSSGFKNITFNNPQNISVYFFLDDNAKIINFTMNVSGALHGFSFFDQFDDFSFIDKSQTDAHLDLSGVIMPPNSSKNFSIYDVYDSSINETKWINITSNPLFGSIIESSNSIDSSIVILGEGALPTATTDLYPKSTSLNLYTSDNLIIPLNISYSAFVAGDNDDVRMITKMYLGGTSFWDATPGDISGDISETETEIASMFFNATKINKTSWNISINGFELSSGKDEDCGRVIRLNNWSNGTFTVDNDNDEIFGCDDLNGTLENLINVNVDYNSEFPFKVHTSIAKDFYAKNIHLKVSLLEVNRSKWSRSNGTVISNSIFDSSGDITKATMTPSGILAEGEILSFFLSANDGDTWEQVSSGVEHTFLNPGTHVKWRIDFNLNNSGELDTTSFISSVNVTTEQGSPSNIIFDFGDDGIIDAFISGELNITNSPVTIDLTLANISSSFTDLRDLHSHTYEIPLRISSETIGLIGLDTVNLTYNPNPVFLDKDAIQTCVANQTNEGNITIVVGSYGGNITIDDLRFDYAGGNQTIEVTAHNNDYTINITRIINYFYSRWDYIFNPPNVNWLEFIPSTPTSKNVTPFGQTSNRGIINLTNLAYYTTLTTNLSVAINDTEQTGCVNLTIGINNSKESGFLINTSFTELKSGLAYLNVTELYMWADYACNYTNWGLFNPSIFIRQCCEDCICSEDLI